MTGRGLVRAQPNTPSHHFGEELTVHTPGKTTKRTIIAATAILATSLLADRCYALPDAEIRVMNLPAMARVTKIPLERLTELSASSPVFAPGVENYRRMGAITDLWDGDLATCLAEALAAPVDGDPRRELGEERGGRLLARKVADRVRRDAV